MKSFKAFLKEETFKGFTPDMVRVLAGWAEKLGLKELQKAGYELYHKMTTKQKVSKEEINAISMNLIKVIRDTEKDKQMFYKTMHAWGINN